MADVGGREAEIEAVAEALLNESRKAMFAIPIPLDRASEPGRKQYRREAEVAIDTLDAVRSSGSAAQNQEDDPGVLHRRHMKHVELLRQQRDEARAERDALAARSPQDEDHEEADRV